MVFAELDRRARRNSAYRMRLGVQMLTTAAYGSSGVPVADAILRGGPFGVGQMMTLAFGLVCAFSALYLVPKGERYADL